MPFNVNKYTNTQERINQEISEKENSRPQLPTDSADGLEMKVKLVKPESGQEYAVIEVEDNIKGGSIIVNNSNHLDLINFIKEIFQ